MNRDDTIDAIVLAVVNYGFGTTSRNMVGDILDQYVATLGATQADAGQSAPAAGGVDTNAADGANTNG